MPLKAFIFVHSTFLDHMLDAENVKLNRQLSVSLSSLWLWQVTELSPISEGFYVFQHNLLASVLNDILKINDCALRGQSIEINTFNGIMGI